jgi:hypothetical protein
MKATIPPALRALVLAAMLPTAHAAVEATVSKVELKSAPANEAFCDDAKCWLAKGATVRLMVHGIGIAAANAVSDNSGSLDVEITGAGGVGRKEINVKVSADGARGEKTVTLRQKVGNMTMTEWKFRVHVINRGKVTQVAYPTPNSFFTEATVTVSGTDLGNARVYPHGMQTFNTPAPAVTKTDNSADEVKVKFVWPTRQSAPTVKFRLCDEALPNSQYCLPIKYGQAEGVIKGPPAVASIGFTPQPARRNDVMDVTFALTSPARAGGETIRWQLADYGNFEQVESACPYDGNGGMNAFTIPAGNTLFTCKIKVASAQGIAPITQWIKTWILNSSTTEPPYFKQQEFLIRNL